MNIFDKFKSIGADFLSRGISNKLDQVSLEKKALNKKVDEFIARNMLDVVLVYQNSGYEMTPAQQKKFDKNIESMKSHEVVFLLDRLYMSEKSLSDDLLLKYMPQLFIAWENMYEVRDSQVSRLYSEKILNPEFSDKFRKAWQENIDTILARKEKREDVSAYIAYKSFGKYLLKNLTLDEVSILLEKAKRLELKFKQEKRSVLAYSKSEAYYGELVKDLLNFSLKNCADEIKQHQKKIEVLYSDNHIDQLLVEENQRIVNQLHVKDLPAKAKVALESLKSDYLFLHKKRADLNDEEKYTLDNLWNKRIPEIINKYFRADAEFRSTMKNEKGQTIEDLMIDSLSNIHGLLKNIKERHTENLLLDMEGINRYTKALKV